MRNTLALFAAVSLVAVLWPGVAARAQAPQTPQPATFEVVSVKQNRSGELAMPQGTRGRTYTATNTPLRFVIATAYGIPVARVVGGPSWLGNATVEMRQVGGDRFDIGATLPEGSAASQVPLMLRALLAERFKLVAHREMRDAPVYALIVARADGRIGPRLRQASIDCEAATAAGKTIPPSNPGERGPCASEIGGEIIGRGQRLTALARMLAFFAGRPVVDKTNLTGGFDFDLRMPELETPPAGGNPTDAGGGLFAAVQEQLGLKLDPIRAPLEFLVIDSVDHPTEN
jgi:uncharacterized protein (TIGR03435 family)